MLAKKNYFSRSKTRKQHSIRYIKRIKKKKFKQDKRSKQKNKEKIVLQEYLKKRMIKKKTERKVL